MQIDEEHFVHFWIKTSKLHFILSDFGNAYCGPKGYDLIIYFMCVGSAESKIGSGYGTTATGLCYVTA